MKNLALFTILALMAACTPPPAEPAGPSETDLTNEANVKVAYAYIDAVVNNDMDALAATMTDNYLGMGPGVTDSLDKSQTIAVWTANWDSLITGINYQRIGTGTENPTEGPNKGDWVMDWANITVDYADGTSATFMFNGVYKVEDGKVVMTVSIYDRWDMMQQRGYSLTPPSM